MRRTRPGAGERAQHVVDGLVGHLAEIVARRPDDRVGVGVRVLVHRLQHGDPRARHPQGGRAQHLLDVRRREHPRSMSDCLEWFKISTGRSVRSGYQVPPMRAWSLVPLPPTSAPRARASLPR